MNKYELALENLKKELLKTYDCRIWNNETNQWILRNEFQKDYDTLEELIHKYYREE